MLLCGFLYCRKVQQMFCCLTSKCVFVSFGSDNEDSEHPPSASLVQDLIHTDCSVPKYVPPEIKVMYKFNSLFHFFVCLYLIAVVWNQLKS